MEMDQEKIMRIHLIEKETNELNEQLKFIEQNIEELKELFDSLEEINKNEKKILVNLGKKVYIPVEIKNKKLIVNVGKNTLIKKNIKDTKKIIHEQIINLTEGKGAIVEKLESLQKETEDLIKNPSG